MSPTDPEGALTAAVHGSHLPPQHGQAPPPSPPGPDTASEPAEAAAGLNDCWNHIGVFGDTSCPSLASWVHCRNCPVYSAAGRSLLERLPPQGYLQEWTTVLADAKRGNDIRELSADGSVVRSTQSLSVMIFRLGEELFALPVNVFLEVSSPFIVHAVPRRSSPLFLGLVNVRGEIMLAASLSELLQLQPAAGPAAKAPRRMAVAGSPDGKWVFPIDEIHGIYLFHQNDVRAAPVVISAASQAFSCGVFQWQNRSVALLDAERIFAALTREIAGR
ncbi:MAG: chemotaxis protein CheW [Synechococcaceae cyanobacterium]|nr:chemotaxis protein CheW [Synechococcaceae cyanobacterium]